MRRLAVGMAILGLAGVAFSWAAADDNEIAKETTEGLKREQDVGKPELIQASKPLALTDKEESATLDDSEVAADLAKSLRKLKDSGDLKDFRISFDVTDGTILMKGTVTSDEQRKLAEKTAKSTDGVCEVVNRLVVADEQASPEPRIEPTPATAASQTGCTAVSRENAVDDSDIARQIGAELCKQKEIGTLKQFNIDLSVENGVVIYEGRVSNGKQLDLALCIARNADGVRDVVSHLTIASPPQQVMAQSDAGRGCEAAESSNNDGVNRLVSTSTDLLRSRRAVQTAGFTSTPAEPIGKTANAVYQPEAQTDVSPDQVAKDQRIGEELMQKLQKARMRGVGFGVHVSDGTVRLKGRVSSSEQQHAALEIARRIHGVRLVVNELTIVEPPASKPIHRDPEAIVSEIGKRLQAEDRKGNLRGCDFDVEVNGSDVLLSGQVASKKQEKLALDTARDIPGVERAISALRVAVPEVRLANVEVSTGQPAAVGISPNVMPTMPMAPRGAYMVYPAPQPAQLAPANQTPRPLGLAQMASYAPAAALAAPLLAINQITGGGGGMPAHLPGPGHTVTPARYDHPNLPGYAWPSYSAHPNYAGVTYPKQYSPTAWPYIGPFYPYPQVPLGWRRVVLKWDDGWWQLNFKAK